VSECVTCGAELHPERAEKYDYCTRPACQAENAKDLRLVAVGVNKASDQYVILDDRAEKEMASGRYRDQGRTSVGRLGRKRSGEGGAAGRPARSEEPAPHRRTTKPDGSWTKAEQNLALAYDVTGRLPLIEIARRLGRDPGTVAKMLVAAKARWRNVS
jgi:hypothetical protein